MIGINGFTLLMTQLRRQVWAIVRPQIIVSLAALVTACAPQFGTPPNPTTTTSTVIAALTLPDLSVVINSTGTLSATGGTAPYTYTKISGTGTLSGATFTAGSSNANAVVKVTDAAGSTYLANVTTVSPTSISQGLNGACAVLSDQTVQCWGFNHRGQLGYGSDSAPWGTPKHVSGLSSVTKVDTTGAHAIALKSDGTVWGWGQNSNGLMGTGNTSSSENWTPIQVSGISTATDISISNLTACAVLSDTSVKCWGYNGFGQIGDGTSTDRSSPVAVSGLTGVSKVSVAANSTCALKTNGEVWCWGVNSHGELGDGTTTNSLTPVQVTGIASATAIENSNSGFTHCVILNDNTIRCWGYNAYLQLADGTTNNSSTAIAPTGLPGGYSASEISIGLSHTCARLSTDAVYCWGNNFYSQLGIGSILAIGVGTSGGVAPTQVTAIATASHITAGQYATCTLQSDASIKCFGENKDNILGAGASEVQPITTISQITSPIGISSGERHTCVLNSDHTISCYGNNQSGQLGDGTTTTSLTKVTVSGISNATQISAGYGHSCARLSTGNISCWGYNGLGELGDGTSTNRTTPVTPINSGNAVSVGTGQFLSCALDGTVVKCWGWNAYGQVGDGTTTTQTTPTTVLNQAEGVSAIGVGRYHACMVLSTGAVRCWGLNTYGALGNGTTTSSSTPVDVTGITNAVDLAIGDYYSCARLSTGSVKCWGSNVGGQLGDGTNTDRTTPVSTITVSSVTKLASSRSVICALTSTNILYCWGNNDYYQLGTGSNYYTNSHPTIVNVNLTGITGILSGSTSTNMCAFNATTLKCWGGNSWGQIGNGARAISTTATTIGGWDGY